MTTLKFEYNTEVTQNCLLLSSKPVIIGHNEKDVGIF